MNDKLLLDLKHLVHNCHTGTIENFHSLALKYRTERIHFGIDGMEARTKLPALTQFQRGKTNSNSQSEEKKTRRNWNLTHQTSPTQRKKKMDSKKCLWRNERWVFGNCVYLGFEDCKRRADPWLVHKSSQFTALIWRGHINLSSKIINIIHKILQKYWQTLLNPTIKWPKQNR